MDPVSKLVPILLALLLAGVPASAQERPEKALRDQIDAAVQGLKIKGSRVGILVYSVKAGRLVLHTGIFDDVHLHPGWKSYDLWSWWAAPFGALSLNDNCVDLRVSPGAEGQPCKVSLAPDTACVTIVNQTKSAAKAARS